MSSSLHINTRIQSIGGRSVPCVTTPLPDLLHEMAVLHRTYLQTAPFQGRHLPSLKRAETPWFALKRPVERTDLLCVDPVRRACFLVTASNLILLRIQLDPQCFGPPVSPDTPLSDTPFTVFAATLSARTLTVEDTLVWQGRRLERESFSERFALAKQWLAPGVRLLGFGTGTGSDMRDIDLQLAPWSSLRTVTPEGMWELQSDEPFKGRLVWSATGPGPNPVKPLSSPAPAPAPAPAKPTETEPETEHRLPTSSSASAKPSPTPHSRTFRATASCEEGPDQWTLTSPDGVDLGRALIKTLAVSMELRENKSKSNSNSKSKSVRVIVTWNTAFNKWEITSVCPRHT